MVIKGILMAVMLMACVAILLNIAPTYEGYVLGHRSPSEIAAMRAFDREAQRPLHHDYEVLVAARQRNAQLAFAVLGGASLALIACIVADDRRRRAAREALSPDPH